MLCLWFSELYTLLYVLFLPYLHFWKKCLYTYMYYSTLYAILMSLFYYYYINICKLYMSIIAIQFVHHGIIYCRALLSINQNEHVFYQKKKVKQCFFPWRSLEPASLRWVVSRDSISHNVLLVWKSNFVLISVVYLV